MATGIQANVTYKGGSFPEIMKKHNATDESTLNGHTDTENLA